MKKIERSYIREILDAINKETISFAGGLPDETLFPISELEKAGRVVLKNPRAFQYSSSYGVDELREKIALFYSEKLDFKTSKEEILITSGSQQAFDLISKLIDKKEVLLESPSYLGAINSFNILDKKLEGFSDLKDLENKLNKNKLLYLISDFQNPSTSSYSKKDRKTITKLLNKNNSFLIEDGAYSFLSFDNKFKKPISSYCKNSFHLGSFSKILSPGLRLGWIRADKILIDKIVAIKEALDLHSATFNQLLINEYLQNNDIFLHIKKINKSYEKKMNYMALCMEKYMPSFKFFKPKGGMFIYGSFDEDSMELAKLALHENIAFVPSQVFYLNKKSKEARFNFTNCSKDEIKKGVKKLSTLLKNNLK